MGGSPTWKQLQQSSFAAESPGSKKRKRDGEDQRDRNPTQCSRFVTRWHHPDKDLRSQTKPGPNQLTSGGFGPRLSHRSRLQSILAKRRRVEQAWEGHRPSSAVPLRVTQDGSKRHHDTSSGPLFSPSWDGASSQKISPSPSLSPTSTKLRASLKECHQGPHHKQPGTPTHAEVIDASSTNRSTATTTTTATVSQLTPCHICHRRPTTRSLLDAYADCNLCGNRTCYICLRECLSPYCMPQSQTAYQQQQQVSGPPRWESRLGESIAGRRICSACAVEGVTEYGEDVVWCLDCVERDGEVEMAES